MKEDAVAGVKGKIKTSIKEVKIDKECQVNKLLAQCFRNKKRSRRTSFGGSYGNRTRDLLRDREAC